MSLIEPRKVRLSSAKKVRPPAWFVLLAVAALAWNLAGVAAFYGDLHPSPERLAVMNEAQRALFQATPEWAWVAYALAVGAGCLGALCLLLRRRLAVALFTLSLVAVLVQMFHAFFLASAAVTPGVGGLLLPVAVIGVAVLLLVVSLQARNHGWIR